MAKDTLSSRLNVLEEARAGLHTACEKHKDQLPEAVKKALAPASAAYVSVQEKFAAEQADMQERAKRYGL